MAVPDSGRSLPLSPLPVTLLYHVPGRLSESQKLCSCGSDLEEAVAPRVFIGSVKEHHRPGLAMLRAEGQHDAETPNGEPSSGLFLGSHVDKCAVPDKHSLHRLDEGMDGEMFAAEPIGSCRGRVRWRTPWRVSQLGDRRLEQAQDRAMESADARSLVLPGVMVARL
jgi:hypothetical protein